MCSVIKGDLRNFAKFTVKHRKTPVPKSQPATSACNSIKKETLAQLLFCEFCEMPINIVFTECLRVTASLKSFVALEVFSGERPCRSVISVTLESSFIEMALRHRCCTVNLLHIFRTALFKNTSGGLRYTYSDKSFCYYRFCQDNKKLCCPFENAGSLISYIFRIL